MSYGNLRLTLFEMKFWVLNLCKIFSDLYDGSHAGGQPPAHFALQYIDVFLV